MERAILDACVLWPSLQRDIVLQVAEEGGFEAAWSTENLREVHRNELSKLRDRHGLPEQQAKEGADSLIRNMRKAFPNAEVKGYEHREGSYGLPDPKDEHVVAAAEQAGIRTIVTDNVRDFPPNRRPAGTEVVGVREFTRRVVEEDPGLALRAVGEVAARSGRQGPKLSVDDVIKAMETRYHMPEVARLLRQEQGSPGAAVSPGRAVPASPRPERRRGGPRTPRLRGDRTERRGGNQGRGQGPRTP